MLNSAKWVLLVVSLPSPKIEFADNTQKPEFAVWAHHDKVWQESMEVLGIRQFLKSAKILLVEILLYFYLPIVVEGVELRL